MIMIIPGRHPTGRPTPRHARRWSPHPPHPLRWVRLAASETRRRVALPILGWRAIRWMRNHPEDLDVIVRAVAEHRRQRERELEAPKQDEAS